METLQQELVFLNFDGLSLDDETLIKDALSAGSELIVFPWESGSRPLEKVPLPSTTNRESKVVTQSDNVGYYEPGREYVAEVPSNSENGAAFVYRTVTEAYSPAQVSPHYSNMMYQHVGLPYPASIAMVSAQPSAYVSNIATSINVGGHTSFPPHSRPVISNAKRLSHSPHKRNKPYMGGVNGHMPDQYAYTNPIPYNTQTFFAPSHPTAQNLTGIPYYMRGHHPSYYTANPYVIPAPTVAPTPSHYPAAVVTTEPAPPPVEPQYTPVQEVEVSEAPEVSSEVENSAAEVVEETAVVESQLEPVAAEVASEPATEAELSKPRPAQEEPVFEEAQPQQKTWASLFKSAASGAAPSDGKLSTSIESSMPSSSDSSVAGSKLEAIAAVTAAVDPTTLQLARHLAEYALVHSSMALLPRGLTNKNNWCYINASLQALLACPPFVHLVKSLSKWAGSRLGESATPIMDSLVEFMGQFETIPVRSRRDRAAKKEELTFGSCFEPSSILRMLGNIRSETFKVEGRQEDAEEFLSCLLNGLHDEMVEVLKHAPSVAATASTLTAAPNGDFNLNGDDEWQLIGPKNRSCVTRSAIFNKTPISDLFLGQMRSALYQSGSQTTATLQPFFSLQLDIQSERVQSVPEALEALVAREPLTGYVCSRTGQEVEASRQTTLEELPPILLLHLKCFVYDKSGGCQKLLKRIEFSADLELCKELLSPNQKGKVKEKQRHYKLFAVVYHDGKEATKGHYVTEVLHTGLKTWLRFDDSLVKQVADGSLFQYTLPRMPYLLFYRRADTFSGPAAAAPASTSPAVSSSRGAATRK